MTAREGGGWKIKRKKNKGRQGARQDEFMECGERRSPALLAPCTSLHASRPSTDQPIAERDVRDGSHR